jgi:pyruvate,orthophosphate dikinase
MIMAETIEDRKKILTKLGQLQKSDFIEIMKAMEGYEVTIRLLDPPPILKNYQKKFTN